MIEASPSDQQGSPGSEVSYPLIASSAMRPGGYSSPAQFLALPPGEELGTLSQLAAQILSDPLAVKQLSDRVIELLRQDLKQQQERNHGYGRRW